MKSTSLACRAGVLATLFLLAAFALPASAQDWYPLAENAQWIYRTPTADVTVTVQLQTEILGRTVWPVTYVIEHDDGLITDFVYYTLIDGDGDVVRVGGSYHPEIGFWEFLPAWTYAQLPPVVGDSWEMGYEAQEWHPAKNGPGLVSWLGEVDVNVPAGQFHVFRCWYADIAPGVGPVRQMLPGMEMEWAELVSYDVPVRTEPTSLSDVKSLFR